jgi:hypothetical protein
VKPQQWLAFSFRLQELLQLAQGCEQIGDLGELNSTNRAPLPSLLQRVAQVSDRDHRGWSCFCQQVVRLLGAGELPPDRIGIWGGFKFKRTRSGRLGLAKVRKPLQNAIEL